MGGKLFNTQRKPREEYFVIEAEICEFLEAKYPGCYHIPRYYTSKPDFGDMDIIVSYQSRQAKDFWEQFREELASTFEIAESKQNGPVYSAVYRSFQLDFIGCEHTYFESCYQYMSFNDVGNLLGKIFRRMGLKYGNRGLSYVFRRSSNENYVREIELSKDIEKILSFIGLPIEPWRTGFETLEDIYTWLIGSPFFSVEPYIEPKKTIRKKQRKRPTVESFVNYINRENITKSCVYLGNIAEYLPGVSKFFPEAKLGLAIQQELAKEELDLRIARKFNGKLIMEWLPELSGKQLGAFIRSFKASFEDFDSELDKLDSGQVKSLALAHHGATRNYLAEPNLY